MFLIKFKNILPARLHKLFGFLFYTLSSLCSLHRPTILMTTKKTNSQTDIKLKNYSGLSELYF